MRIWILTLALLQAPGILAQARAELDVFVDGLDALSGEFEQRTLDADGYLLESSYGTFALESPDHFRWDYLDPFPQLILADGESVWVFDQELEQVSVRPQSGDGSDSPLALLANPELLDAQYEVAEHSDEEGLQWLVLTPRRQDSQFSEIAIGFRDRALERMDMDDSFGQRTEIYFSKLSRNPGLAPDTFRFTPPDGVDVLGDQPRPAPFITPLEDTQPGG